MTDKTAASWRTPSGYRIEDGDVFQEQVLIPETDWYSLREFASELWQICETQREKIQKLTSALQIIADWPFDVMGDCVKDATSLAKAAISEAEKSL